MEVIAVPFDFLSYYTCALVTERLAVRSRRFPITWKVKQLDWLKGSLKQTKQALRITPAEAI